MKKIRVLIADDHKLLRAGIRALLQSVDGFEVVGEATDGREALEMARNLLPHILLLDIAMPGMNGLEAAARAGKECPGVRVVLLSMYANEEFVYQAVRAGAAGYLLKDAAPEELARALHLVADGEMYFTPAVSKHLINEFLRRARGEEAPTEVLTPRQREVLQLIAEGHTTKEIAKALDISVKTAETHRTQLMERLDIHEVAGLVRYAISIGLVQPHG